MNIPQPIPVKAYFVTTKEEADFILMNKGKLIIITEDIPSYLQSPQYGNSCLMANSLLPDYEAVSHFIEGDMVGFQRIYEEMLLSPECNVYFVSMISALINEIPLGFVFGTEEIEYKAMFEFCNFFAKYYGIHLGMSNSMGNPPTMGCMDPAYIERNEILLYQNNLLTAQEFLYMFNPEGMLPQDVVVKLIYELNPPVNNPNDPVEYENYFRYCMKVLKEQNKVLIDPMVMA